MIINRFRLSSRGDPYSREREIKGWRNEGAGKENGCRKFDKTAMA